MLTDIVIATIGELLGEVFGKDIQHIRDQRSLQQAIVGAVKRAQSRFIAEYHAQDAQLVDAITAQPGLFEQPAVRAALRDLLMSPFRDGSQPQAVLHHSFSEVLPQEPDRQRVDAAIAVFLRLLGREVLEIPAIQSRCSLEYQRVMAEQTVALRQEMQSWREAISHTLAAHTSPTSPPLTNSPSAYAHDRRKRPWHNLPRRTYSRFVGRQDELQKLAKLMLPYPRSRHFAVTLDGIGGVGKSALALEFAHRHRESYDTLSAEEQFDALVWVTAKRTLLTAGGIQQRQQTFSTLADLYREIANVLEVPTIYQVGMNQQRDLVEQTLGNYRTLLIVDNLETVDDEALLSFLRELPDPTKVIVTTRHRIDIAYAIRVSGMPRADALALMATEAANKNVALPSEATDDLFRRTGGIPLAIVWSIGLMSMGYDVDGMLRRLGSGHSDIARFCFSESIAHIRKGDAYRLLLALALFDESVNRGMLGEVAGLGDDEIGRDDGLAKLLQLSLINKEADRFSLLPLTRTFALYELRQHPELEEELREQWVAVLVKLARPYADLDWRRPDRRILLQEGFHLVSVFSWCKQNGRPDIELAILPALLYYYDTEGRWVNILAVGSESVADAELVGNSQRIIQIKAQFLGWILGQQGYYKDAERYSKEALQTAIQSGETTWQFEVLLLMSQLSRRQDKFDNSLQLCQQAKQLVSTFPQSQQIYANAEIEHELGKLARDQGRWYEAQKHFLFARDVFSSEEDNPPFNLEFAWVILGNLGFIEHQLGNLETAEQMYVQAISLYGSSGKGHRTTLIVRLASLEEQRGNTSVALKYAHEALEWSKRLGMVQEREQAEALLHRLES